MKKLLIDFKANYLAYLWCIRLIKRTTAFRWEVDRLLYTPLLILALAISAFAQQDPCHDNFMAMGVGGNTSQNHYVTGSAAGTGAYGRKLADLSGYCAYSYTAANLQGSSYNITSGALFRVFNKPGVFSIYAGVGLGLLNSSQIEANQIKVLSIDSLTKLARDGGGIVAFHKWMPKNSNIAYGGRTVATSEGSQVEHRVFFVYEF